MLLTLSALFALAVASSPSSPIVGRVHDPAGRPAGGVLVVLRDSSGGQTHLAVTGGDGGFRFPDLAAGDLTLTATTADGRATAHVRKVDREAGALAVALAPADTPGRRATSAAWLARLPDGEVRRRFILDCTGCHQFDDSRALKDGAPRAATQWAVDIQRMLGYAGPRSSFPVISTWAEGPAAEWLGTALSKADRPEAGYSTELASNAVITEFDFPTAGDLPHDLAVDRDGRVVVTGMFSNVMERLDPRTGAFERIEIPVPQANPRAVEIDQAGDWWVLLGRPGKVGRFRPADESWSFFDIGLYPHSIAVADDGHVWYNGHFTRDPEQIGRITPASGAVDVFPLAAHPTMRTVPGGPIPYEQRIGPDGRVWVSELQGNRLVAYDPASGESRAYALPTSWSGPRRFDVDREGRLWIPAYAANLLVRLDPASGRFEEIPLPLAGATPYIARVEPGTGAVWIGTSAADAVFRYDPATGRFETYPLPSQGALIRHMAIDPVRGDVWLAYGASPSRIPARIARIRRER